MCFHEKMILPCRDFCTEFMNSCANVLPGDLRDRMKCSGLATEADGPGACISKPGIFFLVFLHALSVRNAQNFQVRCAACNTADQKI